MRIPIRKAILSAVCAAVAIAPLTAASAAVNSPRSPPPGAALVQALTEGWSNMSYRPGAIFIGQGGSPFVRYLAWANWGGTATTRSGQYVYQTNPACTPTYLCPVTKKPVTVYLHDVKTHRGTAYFDKMRWNYTSRNGHLRSIYWVFEYYPGGSVPFWNQT